MMITKDTTEADLKQRREIVGDSVVWCDSAPVKAAIHGRVLIIDGMENAERNVLPTINNLLENREMMLEDGRFLMKKETIQQLEKNDGNTAASGSARLVPVHPAFRVVALGLPVPPYHGRVLDPPLRSRFQSRFINELSLDDALNCVDTSGFATAGGATNEALKTVAGVYEGLRAMRAEAIKDGSGAAAVPCFTLDGLRHCLNLLRNTPNSGASPSGAVSVADALSRSIPLGYMWRQVPLPGMDIGSSMGSSLSQKHKTMLSAMIEKVRALPVPANATASTATTAKSASRPSAPLTTHQNRALDEITQDLALGRNICLLGGKGCGKSHLLQVLAGNAAQDMLIFPVYQEMSGRDLLQRRGTSTSTNTSSNNSSRSKSSSNTSSLWLDSPLTKAARLGKTCVLDGVDRIDPQALLAIRSLISSPTYYPPQQDDIGLNSEITEGWSEVREIDLPSGERLQVHKDFRLIGLGAPPTKSEDARMRYLNSDLNLSYHLLPEMTPGDVERVLRVSTTAFQAKNTNFAKRNVEMLTRVDTQLIRAIHALYTVAGKANPELKPSLRHAQRIHATLRTMLAHSEESLTAEESSSLVHKLLAQALLVRFLTTASAAKFEQAMENAGIAPAGSIGGSNSLGGSGSAKKMLKFLNNNKGVVAVERPRSISVNESDNTVTVGNITVPRRRCELPELVPQPLFHENASHLQVLESLLVSYKASYETDEKAILLIGNQGVGKNKLVDRLLQVYNIFKNHPFLLCKI